MNAKDLEALGLAEEQITEVLKLSDVTVERALMGSEAKAEEAYHQLRDAMGKVQRLEAEHTLLGEIQKFRPRDTGVVSRLVDPEKDVHKQLLELRKQHGYLFEGAERGGAEHLPAPAQTRIGMNQILRQG